MCDKISGVVSDFGADAIFLDIVQDWRNDPDHDWVNGLKLLVEELHRRHHGLLVAGEGAFDAILPYLGLLQQKPPALYPDIFNAYAKSTYHLSQPAPGKGSTGVHEKGFARYEVPDKNDPRLPQLTIVDDTWREHQDEMELVIAMASEFRM